MAIEELVSQSTRVLRAILVSIAMSAPTVAGDPPVVIAHRGASAYVPEHTLLAVTAAHTLGADYIEQDIVLSSDGVPVVLHDIHLETTTDVASRFPQRARADGRWYAIDFTLEELKTLNVSERRNHSNQRVFPERFPLIALPLQIPTLADEIMLIKGLNASRGTDTGYYIELKAPQFHRAAGYDIAAAVIAVLESHDLNHAEARVLLQCFDPITLQALHQSKQTPLPLIQLIGANSWDEADDTDYDSMRTVKGIEAIARYADGVGPWIPHLFEDDHVTPSGLVNAAHQHGLLVHPYTLRRDALALPAQSFDELQRRVFVDAGVDGAFSDFPDLTRDFIDRHWRNSAEPQSP